MILNTVSEMFCFALSNPYLCIQTYILANLIFVNKFYI